MNDKGLGVLVQYGITPNRSSRAKGALLLDTNMGYYLLKEFHGSEKHLQLEADVQGLFETGKSLYVDRIIPNQEGKYVSVDSDGLKYCVKRWYMAKDCDVWNQTMLYQAVRSLAFFHSKTEQLKSQESVCTEVQEKSSDEEMKNKDDTDELRGIQEAFQKHNRELKRCRNYIRKRNRKNEFECLVLESFDEFYNRGMELTKACLHTEFQELERVAKQKGSIQHGSFNYHNILFVENVGFLTNFEHCKVGLQLRDLYVFLRKVLEKHSWNYELGSKMIEEYTNIHALTQVELEYLKTCLSYPEKYWKILSHYYNSGKTWIPDKDIEKLKIVIRQEDQKERFLRSLG